MEKREYKGTGKLYCPGNQEPYNGRSRTFKVKAENREDAESKGRLETLIKLGVPKDMRPSLVGFVEILTLTSSQIAFKAPARRPRKRRSKNEPSHPLG